MACMAWDLAVDSPVSTNAAYEEGQTLAVVEIVVINNKIRIVRVPINNELRRAGYFTGTFDY